jgi:hypothetical protein
MIEHRYSIPAQQVWSLAKFTANCASVVTMKPISKFCGKFLDPSIRVGAAQSPGKFMRNEKFIVALGALACHTHAPTKRLFS